MNNIEHLKMLYQNDIDTDLILREKIYNEENGKYLYVPSYEGRNKISIAYAIFVEHDFNKAKQSFYYLACVAEFMSVRYDWHIIESGFERICCALLSDNQDLILRFSTLKNAQNDEINMGYQLSNAIQNILLSNWDKLDKNIANLERLTKAPKFKWYIDTIEVLKGFRNNDELLIKDGLQKLLKTHKKRNKELLIINKFLSIDTAGLCKLAWIKGYEIELKSSLVPIELMPIKPLEKYEDYEFLKD